MEKALLILYNYVFPVGYISTVLLNIDNIKGVMLTFLAVIYGMVRIIFYVSKQDHERRMRNLDYEERKRKLNEQNNNNTSLGDNRHPDNPAPVAR